MSLLFNSLLSLLLLSFSIDAAAQSRDLLVPVPESELSEIRDKNDYFLRKLLCHVKRYRIVTVNTGALLSNEPVRIQLFDDDSIVLYPTAIKYENGGVVLWYGLPEEIPEFRPNPYLAGQKLVEARERHEAIYEVTIGASVATTDSETGANFWRLSPGGPSTDTEFYGLSANFRSLDRRNSYRIGRVDMGGPYHVLYEGDPSKGPMPGSVDDYPERAKMRRTYRNCVESLGADPRKAALLEIERRKSEQ